MDHQLAGRVPQQFISRVNPILKQVAPWINLKTHVLHDKIIPWHASVSARWVIFSAETELTYLIAVEQNLLCSSLKIARSFLHVRGTRPPAWHETSCMAPSLLHQLTSHHLLQCVCVPHDCDSTCGRLIGSQTPRLCRSANGVCHGRRRYPHEFQAYVQGIKGTRKTQQNRPRNHENPTSAKG